MRKLFNLCILLLLFIIHPQIVKSQVFVNVSASGNNDGTSWANAYTNLQTAIDNAKTTDTLWVTSGTYYPTAVTNKNDSRSKAFLFTKTFAIYGGFSGTETAIQQRNSTAKTTLSGDINTSNDSTDNAYHIMLSSANGTIDGFHFTNGNANGTGYDTTLGSTYIPRNIGGALYALDVTVYVNNCLVEKNYSTQGGAGFYFENSKIIINNSVFNTNISTGKTNYSGGGSGIFISDNSNLSLNTVSFKYNKSLGCQGGGALRCESSYSILKDVQFTFNFSNDGDGGGAIYNLKSNSSLTNVWFEANTTEDEAGGIYNDESIPTMDNVTFINNSCGTGGGGAMENDGGSNAIIKNSLFKGNSSLGDGGAIQNWKSSIVLDHVTFTENTAAGNGGAMVNYNQCSPSITNVKFIKNTAKKNGGGLHNSRNSHPIITNTIFTYNHAGDVGGGFYNFSYSNPSGAGSSPILTNVTIANNTAVNSAGGVYTDAEGSPQLRNSIIHGNYASNNTDVEAPNTILASAISNVIVGTYYLKSAFSTPVSIPSTSPIFEDTSTMNYHLAIKSLAINVGDSSYFSPFVTPNISKVTFDIAGAKRIMGSNIDLGAYESCDSALVASTSVIIKGNKNLYYGDTVFFKTSVVNEGDAATYDWYINHTLKQSGTNSIFYAIAGTDFNNKDSITVVMHSSNICAIDSVSYTDTMNISCDPAIVASTNIDIKVSKNIKYGDSTLFTTTAINKGNSASFNWYINDTLVKSGSDSTFIAIAGTDFNNADKISIVMFSSNLCAKDSVYDEVIMQIGCDSAIVASTAVSLSYTPNKAIHFDDVVTYSATSINQGTTPKFNWYINNQQVKSGADSFFTAIAGTDFNNLDEINVVMLSSNLCALDSVSDKITMHVTCDSLIVLNTSVSLTYTPSTIPKKGNIVLFTASAINQGDSAIYNWYVNKTHVKSGFDSIFSATAGTDFNEKDTVSVTMFSSNLCALDSVSDFKIMHIDLVGIQNNFGRNSFNLYPNPNNGVFNIIGNVENSNSVNIEILNISGQKVFEKQLRITTGNLNTEINVRETLKPGIYFMRIFNENQNNMIKFIINAE